MSHLPSRALLHRLRLVLLGAALCVGCTAPLVLAEDPDIDGPLVPAPPAESGGGNRGGGGGSGDPPQISGVDGGGSDAGGRDSGFAEPNDVDASETPKHDGSKDAGRD